MVIGEVGVTGIEAAIQATEEVVGCVTGTKDVQMEWRILDLPARKVATQDHHWEESSAQQILNS